LGGYLALAHALLLITSPTAWRYRKILVRAKNFPTWPFLAGTKNHSYTFYSRAYNAPATSKLQSIAIGGAPRLKNSIGLWL
jgi:hypothetical protein